VSKDSDDKKAREAILARRRFFIASALTGVTMSACDSRPAVCLSPPPDPEPTDTQPQVCLSQPIPQQPDAGVTEEPDAGEAADGGVSEAPDAGDGGVPRPCLSVVQPQPSVCLKIAPPKGQEFE
jgi:hypothetical protein